MESQPQNPELDRLQFLLIVSVYLKTTDHFSLKLLIFCGHTVKTVLRGHSNRTKKWFSVMIIA